MHNTKYHNSNLLKRICKIIISIVVISRILLMTSLEANTAIPEKPNFIIIFTDDQGYNDLGCFGSKNIKTPKIDELAREGMKLTSFYSQPVCGPARAALLTGCYPPRVNGGGWNVMPDEITLAEILQQSGYKTGCVGKWDISGRRYKEGMVPNDQGFDYYYGPLGANDKGSVSLWRNRDSLITTNDMSSLTGLYTEEAIKFITRNKNNAFFLYLAHTMPHVKIDASQKFKEKSDGGLYGDVIEEIDWSTGKIIDVVKDLKLQKNTFVLFTSDNGPWISKGDRGGSAYPLREGKGSSWEGGFRVPAIIWGPGNIPENKESNELLTTLDILPTFTAMANAKMPDDRVIDGINQSDLLLGKTEKSKRETFFYYIRDNLHAVRKDQWKLALPDRKEFYSYAKDKIRVEKPELYNLTTDISETTDLSADQPERVAELLNLAKYARRDIGDSDKIGINSRNIPLTSNNIKYADFKKNAIGQIDMIQSLIDGMSDSLWIYSETAQKEYKSSQLLISKLREAGFSIESGVAELPTAFIASYGTGSPVIGILAEYDALPGVGNEPVPHRQSRKDGTQSGHGCGHNLFGAASVGGAVAIKNVMVENKLQGTLKLFGTPAEETVVGKVYMAKAGVFNGLDAVIDWHPGTKNKVKNQPGRAMNSFEVEFFGQAAHGAADPWNGRSALDAVELMNYAVNMMREHIKPTARIHYVIPNAGDAPNVVPEYAKVWYYVRDINREEVQKSYNRILKIAEGAALATETTYKVNLITGVHRYLLNRPLQESLQRNLQLVGTPIYTDDEQEFARTLQQNAGKKEVGFNEGISILAGSVGAVEGGSTDVAEVSWIVPTAGFSVTTAAANVPWHSWATTACHGTSGGRKGAIVAAKIIATTGIDLLTNEKLITDAKEYFLNASKGKKYVSPLD